MDTFTLTQVHFLRKNGTFTLKNAPLITLLGNAPLVTLS